MLLSKNCAIKVLPGGKFVGSNTLRAKNSLKKYICSSCARIKAWRMVCSKVFVVILIDGTRLSAAPCSNSLHHKLINTFKLFIQTISPFRIGLGSPTHSWQTRIDQIWTTSAIDRKGAIIEKPWAEAVLASLLVEMEEMEENFKQFVQKKMRKTAAFKHGRKAKI